jgi:hypothetical protein
MSQAHVKKPDEGLARRSAREAVERGAAQRELQEKLRRIEILRNFSRQQFSRLNRSITLAAFWIVVIAGLTFAAGWYGQDAFLWAVDAAGFSPEKKK